MNSKERDNYKESISSDAIPFTPEDFEERQKVQDILDDLDSKYQDNKEELNEKPRLVEFITSKRSALLEEYKSK